jgi:hypothetical protein
VKFIIHLLISEDMKRERNIPTMILAISEAKDMRLFARPRLKLRLISMPTKSAHIKNIDIEKSVYVICGSFPYY